MRKEGLVRFVIIVILLSSFQLSSVAKIEPSQLQNGFEIKMIDISIDHNQDKSSQYNLSTGISFVEAGGFENFEVVLPFILSNVSVNIDNNTTATKISHDDETTLIEVNPISLLNLNTLYRLDVIGDFTPELNYFDNSYQMIFDWNLNLLSNNISVSIILPRHAAIHQDSGDLAIFPNTAIFHSDGERTSVEWLGLSNTGSLNTKVFVQYELNPGEVAPQTNWNTLTTLFFVLFIMTLLSLFGIMLYFRHNSRILQDEEHKNKTRVITTVKPVILTPQEQEILRIISKYDGGILQSDLVDILNYSRARVSQYLTLFEEKGLITKHKAGRQNYITLAAELNIDEIHN